ncbi:uncharacterized protein CC84DRAFT_1173893 [Paraphaeosphaeria sporulosa]|uniref:Uncharacterized protein n=1 Tax=Paraphaeosphaeria sporulosa TaxID=1460663 RepID=A0A177CLH7_9PLEO|nr:uncharacterized protein CC84DRAFT_1173893 [Paraphaeosphaeria sporulosa]OAG08404.1 hypothetical protein CC84DRAFT_1173893 [Paraphaeosphaeria sporulosa]
MPSGIRRPLPPRSTRPTRREKFLEALILLQADRAVELQRDIALRTHTIASQRELIDALLKQIVAEQDRQGEEKDKEIARLKGMLEAKGIDAGTGTTTMPASQQTTSRDAGAGALNDESTVPAASAALDDDRDNTD